MNPDKWPDGESIVDHPKIRGFFEGSEGKTGDSAPDYAIDNIPKRTADIYLIDDADSSQTSALVDAIEGKDLVIQGPPGTGKSQTITNLIACALWQGKSVLFVAEKLAALKVVKHRLDGAGLGDFCLELHSNKVNKLSLLRSLKDRLQFIAPARRHGGDPVGELDAQRRILHELVLTLESTEPKTGLGVQELLIKATSLRLKAGKKLRNEDFERLGRGRKKLRKYSEFEEQRGLLLDLISSYKGLGEPAREHVWSAIGKGPITASRTDLLKQLGELAEEAAELKVAASELGADIGERIGDKFLAMGVFTKITPIFEHTKSGLWIGLIPSAVDHPTTLREFVGKVSEAKRLHSKISAIVSSDPQTLAAPELTAAIDALDRAIPYAISDLAQIKIAGDALNELHEILSDVRPTLEGLRGEFCLNASTVAQLVECAVKLFTTLSEAPLEHLHHRSEVTARAGINDCLTRALGDKNRIVEKRDALKQTLHLDLSPARDEVIELKRKLSTTGFFSFLDGSWRKAKATHLSLRTAKPAKWSASDACSDLDSIVGYFDEVAGFNNDPAHLNDLGTHFKGLETDFDGLTGASNWLTTARSRFPAGNYNQQSETFLRLRSSESTKIREVRELAASLQERLERIIEIADWIKGEVGNGPLDWAGIDEALKTIDARASEIRKAHPVVKAAGFADTAKLGEISTATAIARELTHLRDTFVDDALVREMLGTRFAGLETDVASIANVLAFIDLVYDSKFPPSVQAAILSRSSESEMNALSGRFSRLSTAHDAFNASLAEFGVAAGIDKKRFALFAKESIGEFIIESDDLVASAEKLGPMMTFRDACMRATERDLDDLVDLLDRDVVDPEFLPEVLLWQSLHPIAKELIAKHPTLQRSGTSLQNVRKEFARLDKKLIGIRREQIAAKLAGADLPRGYNAARVRDKTDMALIHSQVDLVKPKITVRNLLNRAGGAIRAMKPCFMMGPLSVAQFLARGSEQFDLVVMDEASQMRPEDALGAIARGRQVIVVGDGKQLPPTSFFSRFGFKDDSSEENENTVIDEAESILEAAGALYQPSRQLKWHYRSQHESLIAFSNYKFYRGSLVVFPSPHGESVDHGVKFFRITGAQYGGSKNEIEAMAVAKAVIEHVKSRPTESLGVVAMNIQQAALITECVDKLLKGEYSAQAAYTAFHERHDEVFIKNLENVQGDERDVIYISVTYGPNEYGVIHNHFGPITGANGWRRLNVLFTRARKRVHVYSSMSGDQIELEADASLGLRSFKEYLNFAETGTLPSGTETGRPAGSPFEEEVEAFLLEKGFECRRQLGVATYFLDLAVRHPQRPGSYLLGVECDGVSYHSSKSARDRDRLRQEILERMGWEIHRIWSTDWFRDPHNEIRLLMEKLAVLIDRKATAATEVEPTPVVAPTNSYEDNLRFIQSKTPSDWFAAARWAKTEDTLSTYQRRLLYLIGTYITDREEIDRSLSVRCRRGIHAALANGIRSRVKSLTERAEERNEILRRVVCALGHRA